MQEKGGIAPPFFILAKCLLHVIGEGDLTL